MKQIYAITVSWKSECLVCAKSEQQAKEILALAQKRLKEESGDISIEFLEIASNGDLAQYDDDYLVLGANEGLDDLRKQIMKEQDAHYREEAA